MKYETTFLIKARPNDVFMAIHEYKLKRTPNEFFSWLFMGTLVKMDFRVLTRHPLGMGAIYDWKFKVLGIPFLAFQEKVVEWVEGRTVAYRAIAGWDMFFRLDVEPEEDSTRVRETINFSTGSAFFDQLLRPFIEWGLHEVGRVLVARGLDEVNQR